MRLSCTVLGDNPSGIVKFMGRSHVLRIGDELNGFRVTSIGPAEMVLMKGGSRLVLVNEAVLKVNFQSATLHLATRVRTSKFGAGFGDFY